MRAVITVIGKDNVGILHRVSGICAEYRANVIEVTQSVLQDMFAMIMLVDLADCTLPFDQLAQLLKDKGVERGLDIHVQRQDIFEAMHRI